MEDSDIVEIKRKKGRPVGWRKPNAKCRMNQKGEQSSQRGYLKTSTNHGVPRNKLVSRGPGVRFSGKKVKFKKKPPGKPWQRSAATSVNRICLLCLRRYNESFRTRVDFEEDDEIQIISDSSVGLSETIANDRDKKNVYFRFLQIANRYLQIKTKRFRNCAETASLSPPFCENCDATVQKLCTTYAEWQRLRLNFLWRMAQISDIIKVSKIKISGKLTVSLLKTLSTQLHIFSSRPVDLFRKQLSIKCSAKVSSAVLPRVSIDKNSCINATKHKLLYPFDHMTQYLKSLIVVFTLAVPQKEATEQKPTLENSRKLSLVKKTKLEAGESLGPEGENHQEYGNDHDDDDDNHFDGGECPSPLNEDDGRAGENGSDSDWSMHANESAGSDVEFSVNPTVSRRWNLRKRKTRSSSAQEGENAEDENEDTDELPPLRLRAPRGSRIKPDISELKFSCNLCSRKFRLERSLKRHLGNSHAFLIQYKCSKCNLNFKKSKELDEHNKHVHPKSGYQGLPFTSISSSCSICGKVFPSKSQMMVHRRTHKVMQIRYTCEVCKKIIVGKPRFDTHMRTHEKSEKRHQCSKCPRSFGSQSGLDMHLKIHEQRPDWVPGDPAIKRPRKEPSEKYICDFETCGKIFFAHANYLIHRVQHELSLSCEVCNEAFTSVKRIRTHLTTTHETEEKLHFCLHCEKAYTQAQTYNFHRRIAHSSKMKLFCDDDLCTETFDTTQQLRDHLIQTHVPEDFNLESGTNTNTQSEELPCPIESTDEGEKETGTDENPLNKAVNSAQEASEANKLGLFTCDRCDWSFCQKYHLSLHKFMHTPKNENGMYPCQLCEMRFRVPEGLQSHHNRMHGLKAVPYVCLICGVWFSRKEKLTPHLKTHTEEEQTMMAEVSKNASLKCSICSVVFENKHALLRHVKQTHKTPQMCDQCDASFPTADKLMLHQHEVHGAALPFACDMCPKAFLSSFRLRKHMVSHSEASLQCPMCPKMFRRRTHLDEHILVHKQEKNHICDFCGKAFVKKSSLYVHFAVHSTDKKYKCAYCDKAFTRKFPRDCHERTHTKEKPYSCKYCGKAFSQHSSLRAHTKIHEKLNSDAIVRRPFRPSVATGNPLPDLETFGNAANAEGGATTGTTENCESPQSEEEEKPEVSEPTDSGIIHEALKAAFHDINLELVEVESPLKNDELERGSEYVQQQELEPENSSSLQLPEPRNDDGPPVKRKRGRPPKRKVEQQQQEQQQSPPPLQKPQPSTKNVRKELVCGFCGKEFQREKPYKSHVDRHLSVDAMLETADAAARPDSVTSSSTSDNSQEQSHFLNLKDSSLHKTMSTDHIQEAQKSTFSHHISIPTPPPPNVPQVPAFIPRNESPRRNSSSRKGRNIPSRNCPPGSRLAQIVEEVIGAATTNQSRTSTPLTSIGTLTSSTSSFVPNVTQEQFQPQTQTHQQVTSPSSSSQFHHQSSPHSMQASSPHLIQSQSPHLMMQSASESSTPAGSPAPHNQQQTTQFSPNLAFPNTPFFNPFLLTNHLLRQGQDQHQQVQSNFSAQQQLPQSSTFTITPTTQQMNVVSQQTQQYHRQYQQQQNVLNSSRPQDLSKSSYAMFYSSNPR